MALYSGSRITNGRQMILAIWRPLAEAMSDRVLSISDVMIWGEMPLSSIERGSAGRKESSERIEARRLPAPPITDSPALVATMVLHAPYIRVVRYSRHLPGGRLPPGKCRSGIRRRALIGRGSVAS